MEEAVPRSCGDEPLSTIDDRLSHLCSPLVRG